MYAQISLIGTVGTCMKLLPSTAEDTGWKGRGPPTKVIKKIYIRCSGRALAKTGTAICHHIHKWPIYIGGHLAFFLYNLNFNQLHNVLYASLIMIYVLKKIFLNHSLTKFKTKLYPSFAVCESTNIPVYLSIGMYGVLEYQARQIFSAFVM